MKSRNENGCSIQSNPKNPEEPKKNDATGP
jgi:hypothetical protein